MGCHERLVLVREPICFDYAILSRSRGVSRNRGLVYWITTCICNHSFYLCALHSALEKDLIFFAGLHCCLSSQPKGNENFEEGSGYS
ncbi:hypothetical protein PFISCL1PPCAC_948 [Pristionchus fissidentatus]|uniref:Uncharacterized protein n=1 Tax=Pristionchus fissidentatus TaxID=1538716 RepID=A0AAV5UT62_9BILA|nr:hypothetical protein PFISCL1PPCAC_948 [Pristionchus fissidentatus]